MRTLKALVTDLRIPCGELPVTPDKGVEKVTIH